MTGPARAGDRIRLIRPEFRLSEKHWEKRLQTLLGQTRWLRLATLGLGVLAALLAARLVLSLRRSSPAGGETGAIVSSGSCPDHTNGETGMSLDVRWLVPAVIVAVNPTWRSSFV